LKEITHDKIKLFRHLIKKKNNKKDRLIFESRFIMKNVFVVICIKLNLSVYGKIKGSQLTEQENKT